MAVQLFDPLSDYGGINAALQSRFPLYGWPTGGTFYSAVGPFGDAALGIVYTGGNPNSLSLPIALPSPQNGIFVSTVFFFNNNNPSAPPNTLTFWNADTSKAVVVSFPCANLGTVTVVNNGVTLASAVSPALSGQWFCGEAFLYLHATLGQIIVRVNGREIINVAGTVGTPLNTLQNWPNSTISYAGPTINTMQNGGGYSVAMQYLIISDTTGAAPYNDFLSKIAGPMGPRGRTVFVNSDGTMQWTPKSGSTGWPQVDDPTFDGDASYITAGTAGLIAEFGIPTFSASGIIAAQTAFVSRMDDAGVVDIAPVLNIGGTTIVGPDHLQIGNYSKSVDLYLTDPTTGGAWSPTRFSTAGAMQVGVKRTV